MKKVLLINDSNVNIENYPISEALLSGDEELMIDTGTGDYVSTGKTYEWTLFGGDRKIFPEYVAVVLKARFDFLKIDKNLDNFFVVPKKDAEAEEEKELPANAVEEIVDGNKVYRCKYCKKTFESITKLGRHKGLAHAEQVGKE